MSGVRITVPSTEHRDRLGDLGSDVTVDVWGFDGPPPAGHIDLAVRPYRFGTTGLEYASGDQVSAIQGQALGYDDIADQLPAGVRYCNAVGVHEESTAELAVALTLASQRSLDDFARAHATGAWLAGEYDSLLDSRVLLIGYGGIGRAVARRLSGFGVTIDAVARSAREVEGRWVRAMEDLDELVPRADVIIAAVPYGSSTHGLIDDDFCTAMKPGALLVNVARGKVADTDAITRHAQSGHIRLALDVVDPEPLPSDHRLWSTPGVLIAPHVGGSTVTMHRRIDAIVADQVVRIREGRELAHLVLGP